MSISVVKRCLYCNWTTSAYGGTDGRLMGINSAGHQVEEEYKKHVDRDHRRDEVNNQKGRKQFDYETHPTFVMQSLEQDLIDLRRGRPFP